MNQAPAPKPADAPPPTPADEMTGLPGLRSWPAVYSLVLGVFVLVVVALAALPKVFS